MEQTQQGLLEDLVAPRRDTWSTFPTELNEFFPNVWGFESFDETQVLCSSNPPFLGLTSQTDPNFQYPFSEVLYPIHDGLEINGLTYGNDEAAPLIIPNQENYPSILVKDGGELCVIENSIHCSEERENSSKVGIETSFGGERESTRAKKAEGQPSKNLMAERRRRKRLNDRLSMLRSIVPKISKMDRTAILGDTINYMKELLEKIKKLQEEDMEASEDQLNLMGNLKELKPNELPARNSPKFDVERKNTDTRITICCATKPGLLFSTVHKLEALGLDIQQCVISCFNDFSVQASCLEAMEQRTTISTEDIKQELFRSAGYGGRCL